MSVSLLKPTLAELPAYKDALERGWSPDNMRAAAAGEHLARIAADAAAFVASLDDPEGKGAPVTLPDGSTVKRLPGFVRWIWDGEFCGSIGFRWQPGTAELPAQVLGHIGYAVVPWKQNRGCATAALRLLLPVARAQGLPYVELMTNTDNLPSQRVVTANGGVLIERFVKGPEYGGGESLRFRITL